MTAADKIKISLYKEIFKHIKNDYIAVPEVTLAGNIADMLVANGDIHIYEIKSKTDSLKRLPKQIETFKKYANKVTVVAHDRFIGNLLNESYMDNIGIISVNDSGILSNVRLPDSNTIYTPYYLAYFNTKELRETLRGFTGCYRMSVLDAEKKLLTMLNSDEIRRLALFRIKEKFLKEFLLRQELIKKKLYRDALKARFEHIDVSNITPLQEIPYKVFKDFGH